MVNDYRHSATNESSISSFIDYCIMHILIASTYYVHIYILHITAGAK